MIRLSNCKVNTKAIIKEIQESDFDSKLLEYGIVPGVSIIVVKKALFNGPIYIVLDSQRIAIRRSEATHIILQ